jgi:UDP-glucose 4-epimerase
MKILVTGGAGFIGSHIVDAYLKEGHDVTVIDNLSTGRIENINTDRCHFIDADIRNIEEMKRLMILYGPFDVVNHQAAQMSVSDSVRDPHMDIEINIMGTVNVLKTFGSQCKKFIFASSGGTVYGEHKSPRVERDPLEPVSPYGISKLACEKYVHMYSNQFSFDYVIFRYSNVYGPRQNPHGEAGVIAIFIEKIVYKQEECTINGDGEYDRDYIYVSDVVDANVAALSEELEGIHNISTGFTLTTNEIWAHLSNNPIISSFDPKVKHGPHREGDIRFSCCVPSNIQGWRPKVEFHDGIARTINSYV